MIQGLLASPGKQANAVAYYNTTVITSVKSFVVEVRRPKKAAKMIF